MEEINLPGKKFSPLKSVERVKTKIPFFQLKSKLYLQASFSKIGGTVNL